MTTRLYGLRNCDTCRKARKWLDKHDVSHEFIDYREQPIGAATLSGWAGQLGGWDRLINRASTSWRTLSDEEKAADTDAGWLALLAEHPTLIKRPVTVTDDGKVSVGFKEAAYSERFHA